MIILPKTTFDTNKSEPQFGSAGASISGAQQIFLFVIAKSHSVCTKTGCYQILAINCHEKAFLESISYPGKNIWEWLEFEIFLRIYISCGHIS